MNATNLKLTFPAFVVQDLTGVNSPQVCGTYEEVSFLKRQWMEWKPTARPYVTEAAMLIAEALHAGLECAKICPRNATYHERTIRAALCLFGIQDSSEIAGEEVQP